VNEQTDPTSQAGQRAAADQVQRNLAAAPAAGAAGVAASAAGRALREATVAAPAAPMALAPAPLVPAPPPAPGASGTAGSAPLGFVPPSGGQPSQPAVNVADRLQRVGDRAFVLRDGVWTDTAFSAGQDTRKVAFGSDAYFALLAERPELAAYFAVGERVIVILDGQAYEVTSAE
jgi:Ca-activated chloride channel family protein